MTLEDIASGKKLVLNNQLKALKIRKFVKDVQHEVWSWKKVQLVKPTFFIYPWEKNRILDLQKQNKWNWDSLKEWWVLYFRNLKTVRLRLSSFVLLQAIPFSYKLVILYPLAKNPVGWLGS